MNNMPSKKSVISLALGSAFAVTLGTASVASAAENPFAAQSLEKGYMVADSHRYHDDKGGYEPSRNGYGEKRDGYGEKRDGYGERRGDKKYGEGRCGMSMADTDNDGRVSKDEHARHAETMFERMDTNRAVTNTEYQRWVFGYKFSPLSYFSVDMGYRNNIEPQNLDNDDIFVLGHFFF